MGSDLRLLLDTHTAIWWWNYQTALIGRQARDAISEPEATIFVSAVSAWEIGTKVRLGKLDEAAEVPGTFERLMARHGFSYLPLDHRHALRSAEYEVRHNDPFDRMLVAQAEIEGLTFLTKDRELAAFPCRVLW